MNPSLALIGIVLLLSTAVSVLGDDTGIGLPGTAVDDNVVGTLAWSNPNNIKEIDDSNSIITGTTCVGNEYSHYLKVTNFGFSVPTGATIDGINVTLISIQSSTGATGSVRDEIIKLVLADGSIGSEDKHTTVSWPFSPRGNKSFGGVDDLWSESWTAEDINDVDFGMVIQARARCIQASLHSNTLISTPQGYKKISDLKIKDKIYSFNIETGKIEEDEVDGVYMHPISSAGNKYYYIYLEDNSVVRATYNHLFYVCGKWAEAQDLMIGNILKNDKLEDVKIKNIAVVNNNTDDVWDITVKKNSNFFADKILVHNLGSGSIDAIGITVYYTPEVSDSCTCPGGNWIIDCLDNCSITSNCDLGSNSLYINGEVGSFEILANITVNEFGYQPGCIINNVPNDNKELRINVSGG